jgi:LysR family transcriptional regulator, hypochlorite-specific transcription factor HypT
MQIAAMLEKHHIHMQEPPVCESASAEALLAQVKAGLGSAWIPQALLKDVKTKRCAAPEFFDIPYKILLVKPARVNGNRLAKSGREDGGGGRPAL